MDFAEVKEQLIQELKEKYCLTRADISKALKGDKNLIERIINDFVNEDKIAIKRNEDFFHYIFASPPPEPSVGENNINLVFMSYGHECKGIKLAYRLCTDLEKKGDYFIWLDSRRIPPGSIWPESVEDGIKKSKLVLAILTPHAIRREGVCPDEIYYAIEHKKEIIPIRGDPSLEARPLGLIRKHYLDFTNDAEYDINLEKLLNALEGNRSGLIIPIPMVAGQEPYDFSRDIVTCSENFTGREWLKKEIDSWLCDPNTQMLTIVGDPGSGKSAIAAWMTNVYPDQAIGIHFCMKRNVNTLLPYNLVINLISQMSEKLTGFKKIVESLDPGRTRTNAYEAFKDLIIDPVNNDLLPAPEKPVFVIIDALDEAYFPGKDNIPEILCDEIMYLPSWFRIIATTRPNPEMIDFLEINSSLLKLSEKKHYHSQDIREYLEKRFAEPKLKRIIPSSKNERDAVINAIVQRSEGIFLYAFMAVDCLLRGFIETRNPWMLPRTLSGMFNKWFTGTFPVTVEYEAVRPLLEVIVLTREPLTSSEIAFFSVIDEFEVEQRLNKIAVFFPLNETDRYQPFHAALGEWLKGEIGNDKKFKIDRKRGAKNIAEKCYADYHRGVTAMKPYTRKYLLNHLLESGDEKALKEVLSDPEYFVHMWKEDEFKLKALWVQVEKNSSLRIPLVYKKILKNPSICNNDDFIFNLSEFLDDTGYKNEAIALFEYLVHQYIDINNDRKLQDALNNTAFVLESKGYPLTALNLLKISEYICKMQNIPEGLQKSYGYQAGIYTDFEQIKDFEKARNLFHLQQRICESIADTWTKSYWLQISYGNEGLLEYKLKNYDRAMELYKLKEVKSKEMGIKQGLQWAYGYQAGILLEQQKYIEALALYKKQEDIAEEIGFFKGLDSALSLQKAIYGFLEKNGKNFNAFDEKNRVTEKLKVITEAIDTETCVAKEFDFLKFLEHLKDHYSLKLKEDRAKDNLKLTFEDLGMLALICEIEGNYDRSIQLLLDQEKLCRQINDNRLHISLLNQMRVLAIKGLPEQAMDIYTRNFENRDTYEENVEIFLLFGSIIKELLKGGEVESSLKYFRVKEAICEKIGVDIDGIDALFHQFDIYFYTIGKYSKSIAIAEELERIAIKSNNPNQLQIAIANQGLSYEALGKFDSALECYSRQAKVCDNAKDYEHLAWAILNQGDIFRKMGKLEDAKDKYQQIKDIPLDKYVSSYQLSANGDLGNIYEDLGELDQALEYYHNQEALAMQGKYVEDLRRSFDLQGSIWFRRGDLVKAYALFKKEEEICRFSGNTESLSRVLGYKAGVLYARGDLKESRQAIHDKIKVISSLKAEEWIRRMMNSQDEVHRIRRELDYDFVLQLIDVWQELTPEKGMKKSYIISPFKKEWEKIADDYYFALEKAYNDIKDICDNIGFKMGQQYAENALGTLHRISGDLASSLAAFSRMENICSEIGYKNGLQFCHGQQAECKKRLGEYEDALACSRKQEDICREIGLLEDLQMCLGSQASIYCFLGDFKKAEELFKNQEKIASKIILPYWQQRAFQGQGEVYMKENRYTEALEVFEKQYSICQKLGDLRLICYANNNLMECLSATGHTEEAKSKVLEINEILNSLS